mgnify:CR=1 FL=1
MARTFQDATQYLSLATAIVTAYPFTVAAWANSDDATLNQTIWSVGVSSTDNDMWRLQFRGADAGDPVRLVSRNAAGAQNDAITTTGYTAGTWHHACGVGASATDRRVFIDGGSKGTNTTSNTPAPTNITRIGLLARSSGGGRFDGPIAEVAVWNVALTDDEVLMLAKGLSPFAMRPGSLISYIPLFGIQSPEPDWSGLNNHMTVNGTLARADHPPKINAVWLAPHPRLVQVAQAAAAANPTYQPWYHRAPVLAQ